MDMPEKNARLRYCASGAIGLILLIVSQMMLMRGTDYIQSQQPIDFAHWSLLVGAVLLLSFNYVFPKSHFNSIAIVLTSLGVIAHIGMCAIDLVQWSFQGNYTKLEEVFGHLHNTPSIMLPFFIVGPSLLYIGLATHACNTLKSNTVSSLLTIGGSLLVGIGQFMNLDRIVVVVGCMLMAAGLLRLAHHTTSEPPQGIRGRVDRVENKSPKTPDGAS